MSADVVLDRPEDVMRALRGENKPHIHTEGFPCECGPEAWGLSDAMVDAMAAHLARNRAASHVVSEEAREAAWFRWLRDNPQAAAWTCALVARMRPHGPDLAATMNSGEVVGVMEDAKSPEYRFTGIPKSISADPKTTAPSPREAGELCVACRVREAVVQVNEVERQCIPCAEDRFDAWREELAELHAALRQAVPTAEGTATPRQLFLELITDELDRAYAKHGREPWGRHEFYAILLEEVDELWDAIKTNKPNADLHAEMVQVAAMCFRFWETGDRYAKDAPVVAEDAVQRGVAAWISKINESSRIEHELDRDEIVRTILSAAVGGSRG